MQKVYLFDWGDTLMVDTPGQTGKMCDWPEVIPVDGAAETLARLSQTSRIYVATNAAESGVSDIKLAFDRAGLSQFITGYFCRANLGMAKGTPEFYRAILHQLGVKASAATMVGDSYDNDIAPALEAGLSAIWLKPGCGHEESEPNLSIVSSLREL